MYGGGSGGGGGKGPLDDPAVVVSLIAAAVVGLVTLLYFVLPMCQCSGDENRVEEEPPFEEEKSAAPEEEEQQKEEEEVEQMEVGEEEQEEETAPPKEEEEAGLEESPADGGPEPTTPIRTALDIIQHDETRPWDEPGYKPEKLVKCVNVATVIAELQTPRKGDEFTKVGKAKPGDTFEVVREETIKVEMEEGGQMVQKDKVRPAPAPTALRGIFDCATAARQSLHLIRS